MPPELDANPAPRLSRLAANALAVLIALVAILIAFSSFLSTPPGRQLDRYVKWELIPTLFPQEIPPEALKSLDSAVSMQVYALDPSIHGAIIDSVGFHGYKINNEGTITAPSDLQRLVAALKDGVKNGRASMACFNPRHGLRIVEGTVTHDFLICFECLSLHIVTQGDKTTRNHFHFAGDCQAICDIFPSDPTIRGEE